MNSSAITSEAVRSAITVTGRYFMNWPTTPGQNRSGMKTTILVSVEPMIGVSGNGAFLSGTGELDGTLLFGARVGVEFETPIGPIRVEQGFNNLNRRQALIRVGHWF